ncbi:putative membrane protein [Burkholderia thailandensis MSMB121]|uniref:hypothetical protein n=1 Tax=Burkholderia humptydooensis TaxID=430531 RepID=UPI000327F57E|nr:hypothetical protein [Burkholderia humptydooensis]AGK51600.1 putative membrane protein [Burkholderia thailandensis MSMB121]ATF33549.1 hypothetical protein CO709_09670 [Burkholderia thailandensis]KST71622.1 hypothetical protein WS76_24060 [Burkholderia humptydooensis]
MDIDPGPPPDDRSLRTHAHPRRWLASAALLTPALYALLWLALPCAWRYWRAVVGWGARQLDPSLTAVVLGYPARAPRVPLLSINLAARMPSGALLLATAAVCAAVCGATFVRRTKWLPVAYLLRIAAFAQLMICVYFWATYGPAAAAASGIATPGVATPGAFPYDALLHLRDVFVMNVAAIALIPLVMAALYYPLDFSFAQKAFASLLVLGYFVLALPFVLLLHAVVIYHGSLLFVPFCYFVLGAPLLIGLLVTLYSYCASWRGALTREPP